MFMLNQLVKNNTNVYTKPTDKKNNICIFITVILNIPLKLCLTFRLEGIEELLTMTTCLKINSPHTVRVSMTEVTR